MEPDLLSVPSSELSLAVDDDQIAKSDSDGLHVLTSGVMNTMENLDSTRSLNGITNFPPSELLATDVERDGEITLHSSFIPENAILMETPRGLMLTVPDGISYEDISPNDSGSRPMLSCVPVSFFKTCDVTEDGESNVCDDVNQAEETMESHLGGKSSGLASISKNMCEDDVALQSHHQIQMTNCIQAQKDVENIEVLPVKRKGGWPKGKKRKVRPEVTAPRAPVTGYVLYAIDRRKEIKQLHPELSFSEITKILGQEWSTMPSSQKDKFLEAAEKDKKRYRDELTAFRSSESYQESVNKKILLQEDEMGSSNTNMGALVIDDEDNSTELHCKVCNVYFSSGHNKKEHMYGKTHLQNITEAVEKKHKKQRQQEQQEQQNLYKSLEGSSDGCLPAVDDHASWPNATENSGCSSVSGTRQSGPVDIHHFMLEFIQKNYEREQEISSLRKHLNKSLQENLIMCKDIQELQEYHCKLQEEVKTLSSTTSSLIVQSDALKMVPTLFGIINL